MRNSVVIITAFCLGGALAGCNSDSSAPSSADKRNTIPAPTAHAAPSWALKLQSKCQNGETEDNCVAGYGFAILNDKRFVMGPGPQGEIRTGTISDDDMQTVSAALAPVLSDRAHTASETHESIQAGESDDTVTLMQGSNQQETLVKTTGTDLTSQMSSANDAKNILSLMHSLATKYYKLPFPDTCLDGASALQEAYKAMQACQADSDCAYIDNTTFDVINSNASNSASGSAAPMLTTDDCTVVTPLVVGNANNINSNKSKLQDLLNQVTNSCGQTLYRPDCSNVTSVALPSVAPKCNQGMCTMGANH